MSTDDSGARARRQEVLSLIDRQPRGPGRGAPEILQRLCWAMTLEMNLAGATITLVPHLDGHAVAASLSHTTLRSEDLPAPAGDLQRCVARWPGYSPAAQARDVRTAFSFPLQVGAAELGALSLYWTRPQRPTPGDLRTAGAFAEIATEILIDDVYDGARDPSPDSALDLHGDVYQAQGMVMVDLAVSLPEALARMRAHAYTCGVNLDHLARGIIDGRIRLAADIS